MPPVPIVNDGIGEKLAASPESGGSKASLNDSGASATDNTKEALLDGGVEVRVKLKKEVSLINAITLIVGAVIGSGIFVSPTGILGKTGSVGSSLFIWLGCGAIALLGCLCYAELGTCVKKSGAEYAYLWEGFGPIPAFLFSWTSILIIRPSAGAIIAMIFAEYVSKPFYPDCQAPVALIKLLACVCLVIIMAVNCWSVRWATRVQDIFTYAKLLCIAILVVIGIVALAKGKNNYFEAPFKGSSGKVAQYGLAFYVGLWAYDGWNNLNYCTEEMKRPEKDMPRAIIIAISLVTLCYLVVNVAYIAVLGKDGILSSLAVAVSVGNLYLKPVEWIIPIFVAASTFGAVNGLAFTSGRLVYAAAREGHLPSLLAMIHVKQYTPLPSLVFTTLISLIMLIPDASSFYTLVDFFSFAAWVFYGLTFAALLWLRYKKPYLRRPYKVFIGIPIIMVIAACYLCVSPFVADAVGSLIALGIIAAGLPFYAVFVVYYERLPLCYKNAVASVTCWFQNVGNLALEDPEDLETSL